MMYVNYLRYLILHKWYVGVACWRMGLRWRAFTHDLSKFMPDEFFPYALHFYGPQPDITEADDYWYWRAKEEHAAILRPARLRHQRRNSHHWQYHVLLQNTGEYIALRMPRNDLLEMICDWQGAGRAMNNGVEFNEERPYAEVCAWYHKNISRITLHDETRKELERLIGYGYTAPAQMELPMQGGTCHG